MTTRADFDLGLFISFLHGSIPSFVTGLVVVIGCAVFFFGVDWLSTKATYRQLAKLYTHSAAFWARWPGDRLWVAPYEELAAEANRCEQLIGNVGSKSLYVGMKKGPAGKKRAKDLQAEFQRQLDREVATYQGLLAAVRNAMNYAVSQGRGPQAPPYSG
ncbi:hypothetical protein VST63_25220 [Mycolicibacterium sp. 050232]|uniref:hypothetical protein n=1 Tax=Mycolicibacterium sp. 050232 TaxID=3113982 RepID=UPI002E2C98B9|nr:hypothetical protein [Mycolicibacterium sp. 050232]MED5815675.1 hypothetical protein [Mycolicibacterium sp. 050232]